MKDSLGKVIKYALSGFVLTTVLVVTIRLVEHTAAGHWLELRTFEVLQGQIAPFNPDENLPIVVVDISKVTGGKDEATPRGKLEEIITAIGDKHPRAIAVDIDFSPEEGKWITQDDETFFDNCLRLREQGTPIFLGVGRRMAGEPSAWLGAEKYKAMAVSLAIKNDDTSRIPLWIKMHGVSERLPSLSAALAEKYTRTQPPNWMAWALETTGEQYTSEEFETVEALVNYSKLEAIEQQALLTVSQQSVEDFGERFSGRMVILGDGTPGLTLENFVVLGRKTAVPGVYLHACAAYTLAHEPLYELKSLVRYALDFLPPLFIIFVIAFKRYHHRNDKKPFRWERRQRIAFTFVTAGALVAGLMLVKWLGVLWLDLLLVAIALLLHPRVENWPDWVRKKLSTSSRRKKKRKRTSGA